MKLSFTKISTFRDCPYKYKALFIDKRGGEIKSDAMAVGEGIHAAVEYLSINPETTWEKIEDIYVKKVLGHSSLVDDRAIGKNLPTLKNYYESGKVLAPLRLVGRKPFTEYWFEVILSNCSIVGKIDIITANLSVVDYKTASRPFEEYEAHDILVDKGLQLSIYALAYKQLFRELPKKVGFQVILKDAKTIQTIISKRTDEDLEAVTEYIENIANGIAKETKYAPVYGCPSCQWCAFKRECREYVR